MNQLNEQDRYYKLISFLTHEIRNSLAAINSGLNSIERNGPADSNKGLLQAVRNKAKIAALLTHGISDLAALSAGAAFPKATVIEAGKILQKSFDSAGGELRSRGYDLTLKLPSEASSIEADATRLEQIFSAVFFALGSFKNKLRVTAELKRSPGLSLGEFMAEGVEADLPSKAKLGLSLVEELVRRCAGSFSMSRSSPDRLEIIISFPETLRHQIFPAAAHPVTTIKRILVVEDHEDSAALMATLLGADGYQVETAAHGAAALELTKRFQPQAILLDLTLPDTDGVSLAQRLKETAGVGAPLIIATSGYSQDHFNQISTAYIDHYLVKPIDFDRLSSMLKGSGKA
jgi:two-component system, chemotaxis family, CheB/CheR fusion protein